MQGASPLASPGLDRLRHWLTLSLWHPAGVLLSLSPAYPAFSLLSCPPFPQPPSPVGKGETLGYFYARGFAPCIPKAGRGTALAVPAVQVPRWGRNHSQGTLFVGFAETYRFSRRGAGGFAPGKIN